MIREMTPKCNVICEKIMYGNLTRDSRSRHLLPDPNITGGPDVACVNNIDKIGWVVETAMN